MTVDAAGWQQPAEIDASASRAVDADRSSVTIKPIDAHADLRGGFSLFTISSFVDLLTFSRAGPLSSTSSIERLAEISADRSADSEVEFDQLLGVLDRCQLALLPMQQKTRWCIFPRTSTLHWQQWKDLPR